MNDHAALTARARLAWFVRELSGGLGDLGTFLPLAIGLITVNHVRPEALFIGAGVLYVVSSRYFRIPMPVQPLKATSALAISLGVSADTIAATSLAMGLLLLLLAIVPLQQALAKVFTRAVVRGIQLGLAVILIRGGVKLVLGDHSFGYFTLSGATISIGVALFFVLLGVIALSKGSRRYPAALLILTVGLISGLVQAEPTVASLVAESRPLWLPRWPHDWSAATVFLTLLLPQIPLTIANSIFATTATARQYYGARAERVTPKKLLLSLGMANTLGGWFGAIPLCHGCGGLTAHYRFGARTAWAGVMIGAVFVAIGTLGGSSLASVAALLPGTILGALLVYVGVEHAALLKDILFAPSELLIATSMGLITLVTGNLAWAFGVTLVIAALGRVVRRIAVLRTSP